MIELTIPEKLFSRELLADITPWIERREIIVIHGARQTGKTSLLKLLYQKLKDEHILYLDLEDAFNFSLCQTPDSFVNYLTLQGATPEKRTYCLIDEIQYLENPSNFLKIIHDHYPFIKLIVTGSSSFEIRSKFKDALTGRKAVFTLRPLNFYEYLRFKQSEMQQQKSKINLRSILQDSTLAARRHILTPKIIPLWEDFLVYGGYPKPTLEKEASIRQATLREIYNSYIRKDIKDIARIDNIYKFNSLIEFLALQNSNLFRAEEVSKEVGINIRTVEKYVTILENTFILYRMRPFFSNRQKELTKMPKIYFSDNGLLNAILRDFRNINQRTDAGSLAENGCFTELSKSLKPFEQLNFWRTKNKQEIDFILKAENGEIIPLEVKYRHAPSPKVPPSLLSYIKKYDPPKAVVITKDSYAEKSVNHTKVLFLPAWML